MEMEKKHLENTLNLICHGCLSTDRKISALGEYSETYEGFIANRTNYIYNIDNIRLCWECKAMLKKFKLFQQQLHAAQDALMQMMYQVQRHPETLSKLSIVSKYDYDYDWKYTEPTTTNNKEPVNIVIQHIKTETEIDISIKEETILDDNDDYADDNVSDCKDEMYSTNCETENDESAVEVKLEAQQKKVRRAIMLSDSESDDFEMMTPPTPPEIKNTAQEVINDSLPEKSRAKYDKCYNDFILWKSSKNAHSFSENVLLTYFNEKAQKYKPSTLWATYSMLKSSLSVKNNVNIKEYTKLTAFLKRKSQGFRSKKSKILTKKDVLDFLQNAPDNNYLLMKVILILGINGAFRSQELLDLTTDDIEIRDDIAIVKLPRTKTKIERSFVVTDTFFHILKRYMDLRPSDMKTKRLLVQFKNNKCVRQVIGKNKIGSVPKKIASYLKLANPDLYTGHCFRRTSATILADTGTDLSAIKRHSGWKPSAVAESYIEVSIENKKQ